jgi:hypothetical protein
MCASGLVFVGVAVFEVLASVKQDEWANTHESVLLKVRRSESVLLS